MEGVLHESILPIISYHEEFSLLVKLLISENHERIHGVMQYAVFLSEFVYIPQFFGHSSILLHVSVLHSFYCWVKFEFTGLSQYVIHSPVDRHFQIGAIMNKASINIYVQFFCANVCFHFSRCGIIGLYGKYMFKLIRNCQSVFQKWCNYFAFPPAPSESFSFSHHLQYLIFLLFLIWVIVVGIEWYFTVVVIFISMMTNENDYLFIDLVDIYISLLVKFLYNIIFKTCLNCLIIELKDFI